MLGDPDRVLWKGNALHFSVTVLTRRLQLSRIDWKSDEGARKLEAIELVEVVTVFGPWTN